MTDGTVLNAGQISPESGEALSIIESIHIQLPFYEVKASAGVGALVEIENQTKTISFEPE